MVSMYLVQMLFADGLYWLIRDYYYKNGKGTGFINAFGRMFEEYFMELAPDVQQIDTFYKRNILEAHEQLKMSEKEYQGQKPVIKIFLLYERMTNTQIVMSSIPEIFVDDSRCYIMTIEDL